MYSFLKLTSLWRCQGPEGRFSFPTSPFTAALLRGLPCLSLGSCLSVLSPDAENSWAPKRPFEIWFLGWLLYVWDRLLNVFKCVRAFLVMFLSYFWYLVKYWMISTLGGLLRLANGPSNGHVWEKRPEWACKACGPSAVWVISRPFRSLRSSLLIGFKSLYPSWQFCSFLSVTKRDVLTFLCVDLFFIFYSSGSFCFIYF